MSSGELRWRCGQCDKEHETVIYMDDRLDLECRDCGYTEPRFVTWGVLD